MLRTPDREPSVSNDRTTLDDLLSLIRQPAWTLDALCKEYPDLPWINERGHSVDEQLAVCRRCAVRVECLAAALRNSEVGVWGATTHRKRMRLKVTVGEADARLSELLEADAPALERGLPDMRRRAVAMKSEDPTLTHQAIADRCGVSRVAVTRWLRRHADGLEHDAA